MERTPVSSSTIASIGYDSTSQTLEIEFINGHIYQYFDVPESYYLGIIGDASPGGYLSRHIKGVFRYARA